VSYASTRGCTAVGALRDSRWFSISTADGAAHPEAGGYKSSGLDSVSCPSANSCTAVGSTDNAVASTYTMPWVAHWNGRLWTSQSLAPTGGAFGDLRGVACSRRSVCTAVGWVTSANARTGLVERYS
jgi:hypothetical protein